jgi:hypothetical protein
MAFVILISVVEILAELNLHLMAFVTLQLLMLEMLYRLEADKLLDF